MCPKNNAELDIRDPKYDQIWESLDAASRKRSARIEQVLNVVKSTHTIPLREIDKELSSARAFLGDISGSRLRKIDRDEYAMFTKRHIATLSLLQDQARDYVPPTAAQITALLDNTQHPAQLAERIQRYESQTILALVSKPEGNEYWQLIRSIANGVRHDRATIGGVNSHRLERVDRIMHMIAPAWIFNDNRRFIPTNSKLAWRTTKVHGIYAGGLPGLGKKA